jgi:hypothetical protein
MRLTEARIRQIVRGILSESSRGTSPQLSRLAIAINSLCDSTARIFLKRHPDLAQRLEAVRGTNMRPFLLEERVDEMIRQDPDYPRLRDVITQMLKRLMKEILDEVSPDLFPLAEEEIDNLEEEGDPLDVGVNVAGAVEQSLYRIFDIASDSPAWHLVSFKINRILYTVEGIYRLPYAQALAILDASKRSTGRAQ